VGFLADRTAPSMIGYYWHQNAVCPSVTLKTVAKRFIQRQKCLNIWTSE